MKTFGTINPKDYTKEVFYVSAPIDWVLVSSSIGTQVTDPSNLVGAVTINRASNSPTVTIVDQDSPINADSGIYEYVLYSSVKHTFYDNNRFYSASRLVTESLTPLPDKFYVLSIGQDFYGNKIRESSFLVSVSGFTRNIFDDGHGNLIISQSGTGSYVGNIFYDQGVAIIKQHTGSLSSYIGRFGLTVVSGSTLSVTYNSDVDITRHQINVKLEPTDFNFPLMNPTTYRTYTPTGSYTASIGQFTSSMDSQNIQPVSNNTWKISSLIQNGVIPPYITSIGLYNDQHELMAVAKLSKPIQRTFDIPQIFIVRFDI